MHDPIYRRLFGYRRMVADLLRVVGDAALLREVDLEALEKLPADYVGDRGQQRRGDTVWRVSYRGGSLYLLILLEFQSTSDSLMALRNLEYTTLLYRELERRSELGSPGAWPTVLPVVLYNGETRWTAELEMRELIAPVPHWLEPCQPSQRSLLLDERRVPVDDLPLGNLIRALVGFEQSRSPDELAQVAVAVNDWLRERPEPGLADVFVDWMHQIAARMARAGELAPLGRNLEEAAMTLVERVAQWPEQWRREGVAQGRREGVAQGRREEAADRLAWERGMLSRQAALRFGSLVGDQIRTLLNDTEDWDHLARVAELVISAASGRELTDAVTAFLRTNQQPNAN
ncbi:MAG: Rpn family recombination-promoting nuclease/putative transposase [Gammaproteobacteria bacterium]|nr:Rpn family recombination-promoting nuclease/putative transposase [Gammaproteobacteria bacterium]